MSALKVLVLILTINIFLYLVGFQLLDNDILTRFVDLNPDGTVSDYASGETGLKENVPQNPTGSGAVESSFVFALAIVWSFIKFLLNIIFAPISLFIAAGFPVIVQLTVGVPLGIAYIFGLIMFIRSGG